MFDVKTRAAVPIRLDLLNFEVHIFLFGSGCYPFL
jgi:hypothetical protein